MNSPFYNFSNNVSGKANEMVYLEIQINFQEFFSSGLTIVLRYI